MNGRIKDYAPKILKEDQLNVLTFAEKIYSSSDNLWEFICFWPIQGFMYKVNYSRIEFTKEGEPIGDFYLKGGQCITCRIKYRSVLTNE
mgnify:CR=1 FL=1